MLVRWNQAKRGTALLLVLFVTTLAVMFIGALLTTNQSSIRLATGLANDKAATANAQSGLDYAWQMLERNRNFGREAFEDNSVVPGFNSASARLQLRLRNPDSNRDTQYIEGIFLDRPHSGFKVFIFNRIGDPGMATAPAVPFLPGRVVPAASALLRIEGFEGKRTRILEATLNRTPFVSHAVLAGGDIECKLPTDAGQWKVRSFDPLRNSVFSKANLKVDKISAGSLLFQPSSGPATPFGRYGAALAADKVHDEGGELTPDRITEAMSQSRGLILPSAQQSNKIKELSSDDLKLPSNRVELEPGAYCFERTRYEVEFTWEKEVTRPGPFGTTVREWVAESKVDSFSARGFARYPNPGSSEPSQVWIAEQHVPQAPTGPGIRGGRTTVREPNITVAPVASNGSFPLPGRTGGVAAQVNFMEGTFDIPADTLVDVPGDFVLQHRGLEATDTRPKLRLVNGIDPGDAQNALTAAMKTSGDLHIEGGLRGSGSLIAGGDLSMYAESSLATSAARPVALFANNDVSLLKDDVATENASSQETLDADWTIYKRALAQEGGLDSFLNDPYETQNSKAANFLNRPIKDESGTANDPDPAYYFSKVTEAYIPAGNPVMLLKAQNAYTAMTSDGQMTLGEAIRLREYCRQLVLDKDATTTIYDPETDTYETVPAPPVAPMWLSPTAMEGNAAALVQDQLASYSTDVPFELVDSEPVYGSLRQWFNDVATNPYENDTSRINSVFRGLIYSRFGNFNLQANFNGLKVIGSLVVPRGKVSFNDASGIETMYDPRYLKDLLVPSEEIVPLKLDQVSWRLH